MTDRLDAVTQELHAFVAERNWEQFHDPKNLAMLLASEAGELLAEYRWVMNEDADALTEDVSVRERVELEAADVGLSLLMFCERVGIDLVGAMVRKLEINDRNYPVNQSSGRSERPA